jgi:hypothetical protein
MDDPLLAKIKKAQSLRQQYAYHLQTARGFGSILAGSVCGLIYLVNGRLGSGILNATFIIFLTLVWFVGKEIIQRHFYQTFDEVTESPLDFLRYFHTGIVIFVSLFTLSIWMTSIYQGSILSPTHWLPLFLIALLPLIAWFYLRALTDFLAGFYLWTICAASLTLKPLNLINSNPHVLPGVGLVLILIGIWEHWEYRKITKQVEDLR